MAATGNEVTIVVKSKDQTKQGFKDVEQNTSRLKSTVTMASGAMAGALAGTLLLGGVAKFKGFIMDSVHAASDLGESVNAVQKVFGGSSGQILQWGKDNASSFGLSQRAFNEMATPMGAMLKNTGLSMQDTTKWTVDLTKRAADMASVFNTSVPDALEAIQAGLRGEQDPLERYGVSLSAAAVQAEALSETHKKAAGELTKTELATARLNLIMRQTASTAGDFQSTSNGLANSQRIAAAQFEDAKAKLGAGLLPIMAKLTSESAKALSVFAGMPGPLQATAAGGLAVGVAFLLVGPRITNAATALIEFKAAAAASNGPLGALAANVGKLGGPLAVATLGFEAWHVKAKTASYVTTGWTEDIKTVTGAIGGGAQAVNDWANDLAGWGPKAKAAEERAKAVGDAADVQARHIDDAREASRQYAGAVDTTTGSLKNNTGAIDRNTEAMQKNASAVLERRADEVGFEAAVDAATASVKENGRTLDVHTEKGRNNRQALDSIAASTLAWAAAARNAGQSVSVQNGILEQGRAAFVRTATQMGLTSSQARTLANSILGIPKSKSTTFSAPGLSGELSQVQRYREVITSINGKTVTVHYRSDGSVAVGNSGGARMKASGGIVGAATGGIRSRLTMVGEHGRELLDLAPGTRVHSNPDTERMVGSGGAGGVTVNMYVQGSIRSDRDLIRMIRDEFINGGFRGVVQTV